MNDLKIEFNATKKMWELINISTNIVLDEDYVLTELTDWCPEAVLILPKGVQ